MLCGTGYEPTIQRNQTGRYMTPAELTRETNLELTRLSQAKFTGKMTIEVHYSQGNIRTVDIAQKWSLKNGDVDRKGIDKT